MALNALALSTLRHIQIAAEVRDRAAPYRTFLDNFYAYCTGGPFLNRSGRPHWHNNPCPSKHGEALRSLHFVSIPAMRVLAGLSRDRLVRDHVVPVAVIREFILNAQEPSLEIVERYVRNFYRLGLITEAEDKKLNEAGLRSRMPEGWHPHDGLFARYVTAGITAQQTREDF